MTFVSARDMPRACPPNRAGVSWLGWLLCAALLAACERTPKTPTERGAGVYLRVCASCHGPDGRGSMQARSYSVAPRDLSDPALHARLTDDELVRVIREGKGTMPSFGQVLADEDVTNLLLYVRTLHKQSAQR